MNKRLTEKIDTIHHDFPRRCSCGGLLNYSGSAQRNTLSSRCLDCKKYQFFGSYFYLGLSNHEPINYLS